MAELSRGHGSKFVTLVNRLDASKGAVRDALDDLIELGLVSPNEGYGHPMRPEYILTRSGVRVGEACVELEDALSELDAEDVARRKWSMPTLWAVRNGPARFSEIGRRLHVVTDRALSMTLRELTEAELIARELVDARPPSSAYVPTESGLWLRPALVRLAG